MKQCIGHHKKLSQWHNPNHKHISANLFHSQWKTFIQEYRTKTWPTQCALQDCVHTWQRAIWFVIDKIPPLCHTLHRLNPVASHARPFQAADNLNRSKNSISATKKLMLHNWAWSHWRSDLHSMATSRVSEFIGAVGYSKGNNIDDTFARYIPCWSWCDEQLLEHIWFARVYEHFQFSQICDAIAKRNHSIVICFLNAMIIDDKSCPFTHECNNGHGVWYFHCDIDLLPGQLDELGWCVEHCLNRA